MRKIIVKYGRSLLILQLGLLIILPACGGSGSHNNSGVIPYIPPNTINYTPVITSTPVSAATAEVAYTYDVNATDLNADPLIYSLEIFPTGMTIDSGSGVINWTPSLAQVGDHTV